MKKDMWKPIANLLVVLVGLQGGSVPAVNDLPSGPDKSVPSHADFYGDPLPPGAMSRMGTARLHHTRRVCRVAGSRDGKTIVSTSADGCIRMWDAANGKPLRQYSTGVADRPQPLSLSPDGRLLAACQDLNGVISVLDLRTGAIARHFSGHKNYVTSLAFSPDGRLLASGSEDATIRLWSVATGKEIRLLLGPKHVSLSLAFSPDGKMLASCPCDGIQLWDIGTGRPLRTIRAYKPGSKPPMTVDVVSCLAFSSDSKFLAGGTGGGKKGDGTVSLWDAASGKLLRRFPGYDKETDVYSVAFSPDGTKLAVGATDSSLRLWESATGQLLHDLLRENSIRSVWFTPDGRTLISGGSDNQVRLWDVQTGKEKLRHLQRPSGEVRSVAYAPDGKTLATLGGNPCGVRLWEVKSGKYLRSLPQPKEEASRFSFLRWGVGPLVFSPDGSRLYCTPDRHTLAFWDLSKREAYQMFYRYRTVEEDSIGPFTLSPNGELIAVDVFSYSKQCSWLKLFDCTRYRERRAIKLPPIQAGAPLVYQGPAFSQDGKFLAYPCGDGKTIYLWDVATGQEVRRFRSHEHPVAALCFSPEGNLLVTCEASTLGGGSRTREDEVHRTIRLWDVATGKPLLVIDGLAFDFRAIAFSPDGQTVVSGNKDGLIRVWEVKTGQELLRLQVEANRLQAFALSPDGQTAASGHIDGTALIWGLAPANWRPPADGLPMQERVTRWNTLASSDAAKSYRAIWDLATTPAETVTFLKERLHPVPIVKPEHVNQLIADLDSNTFARREAASRELSRLGTVAESSLRKTLDNSPSAEQRRRVETLLAALPAWVIKDPETLRVVRAIWVLQRIGTPEARAVLENLAAGAPAARQTQEAKAALQYLDRIKKR